jgi:2-dehydro-3-deoxyphosphogluconate aldolase/(4S)-4-hydroxy-2-oxoglutarate aldolase
VFPAVSAGYIRDIRAPLPHIPLMPTGGITIENIRSFKDAGAIAFGIGSALVDASRQIDDNYLNEITLSARNLLESVR